MKLLTIHLILLSLINEGFAADLVEMRKQEVGPVIGQLLEYNWESPSDTTSYSKAIGEFRFWGKAALQTDFSMPDGIPVLVHRGDSNTCDAVKAEYTRGEISITIIQTRLVLVVMASGQNTQMTNFDRSSTIATTVAKTLLASNDIVLIGTVTGSDFAVGGRSPSHRSEQKEGFLCNKWWCDGTKIAFSGFKVPFGNSSMFIIEDRLRDLNANRRWFK